MRNMFDNCLFLFFTEMGATYEFRIAAKNAVDFGEQAVETIRTPDGSELLNLQDSYTVLSFDKGRHRTRDQTHIVSEQRQVMRE